MKIILICDFSRSVLNTRSARSYPTLAPRPQIRIISFSEGCALAVEMKSEFYVGEVWERLLFACGKLEFI